MKTVDFKETIIHGRKQADVIPNAAGQFHRVAQLKIQVKRQRQLSRRGNRAFGCAGIEFNAISQNLNACNVRRHMHVFRFIRFERFGKVQLQIARSSRAGVVGREFYRQPFAYALVLGR